MHSTIFYTSNSPCSMQGSKIWRKKDFDKESNSSFLDFLGGFLARVGLGMKREPFRCNVLNTILEQHHQSSCNKTFLARGLF